MRAIILAAGMGTRLRPLTLTIPKSLIEVNGTTLIEQQIIFLKEIGIDEIIVVTGYLAKKFDFLVEKYGVSLIYNDKYDVYNNFYTMYLVKDYLSNTYVIDADNYLLENILDSVVERSTYFAVYKEDFKDEWLLKVDLDNRVKEIIVSSGNGLIMSGVSYWDAESGEILQSLLEEEFHKGKFANLYWDNLVKDNLSKIKVYKKDLPSNSIFEVDNLDDLEKLKNVIKRNVNKESMP